MLPYSVLDLSPVPEGTDTRTALLNSADLARHCEALGYHRFWMAEHHNMPGIASAATSVAASATSPGRPRRSASARAASCCPTIRRW